MFNLTDVLVKLIPTKIVSERMEEPKLNTCTLIKDLEQLAMGEAPVSDVAAAALRILKDMLAYPRWTGSQEISSLYAMLLSIDINNGTRILRNVHMESGCSACSELSVTIRHIEEKNTRAAIGIQVPAQLKA